MRKSLGPFRSAVARTSALGGTEVMEIVRVVLQPDTIANDTKIHHLAVSLIRVLSDFPAWYNLQLLIGDAVSINLSLVSARAKRFGVVPALSADSSHRLDATSIRQRRGVPLSNRVRQVLADVIV